MWHVLMPQMIDDISIHLLSRYKTQELLKMCRIIEKVGDKRLGIMATPAVVQNLGLKFKR